ncbi:MAG TPA: STAS domain-containing protein [Gaiellaceae bacterium]|jgi:anti-anti-sigma factor|nr:STAS domain-containing protein [Gaiellaceae bacterium]
MSSYELERLDDGERIVQVRLAGELDLTNARELEERLVEIAPTDAQLVIDLNRVVFVDSAALHVLFKVARRQENRKLVLVLEPTAPIARAIAIVGLGQAAQVVASSDTLRSTAPP